jgi:hypothetical protein
MEAMAMQTLLITKQKSGVSKSMLPHPLIGYLHIGLSRVTVDAPGDTT